MNREDVLDAATWAVTRAKKHLDYIEFSCEDASRSDWDYMVDVCTEVIRAGATVINLPDTTGHSIPEEFGRMFAYMREKVPGADKVIWSAHCHNDLGLAVANSLAAVRNGARQIECTINGLGERAGNTSLEEVVMAVKTRKDFFGLQTRIDTTHIVPTSRLVSQITGFVVQPNKAVVGANAFAHASGIHQDGVLKARDTYEIMRAEDVGWATNKIVLGKLSGRNAFKQRLKELGIELESDDAANKAFQRFKDLADKKAEIFDEDLQQLVAQEAVGSTDEHWKLVTMNQASGMGQKPFAKITLEEAGKEKKAEAQGDGPVDATFKAIESLAKSGAELLLYSVNAVTQGTESQGEVTVRLSRGGRIVNGVGADTDIVVASAKAYISALNKLESKVERLNPQHQL
jgi:2-isopropylmalate synthase